MLGEAAAADVVAIKAPEAGMQGLGAARKCLGLHVWSRVTALDAVSDLDCTTPA